MDGDMIKPNSILNGNTEIHVLNVVKKLYESNAVIDCEFVNKTNEKEYSGKPLDRKTKYGYEMFSVIYTDVIVGRRSSDGKAIHSKRQKEICGYTFMCRDAEHIREYIKQKKNISLR